MQYKLKSLVPRSAASWVTTTDPKPADFSIDLMVFSLSPPPSSWTCLKAGCCWYQHGQGNGRWTGSLPCLHDDLIDSRPVLRVNTLQDTQFGPLDVDFQKRDAPGAQRTPVLERPVYGRWPGANPLQCSWRVCRSAAWLGPPSFAFRHLSCCSSRICEMLVSLHCTTSFPSIIAQTENLTARR